MWAMFHPASLHGIQGFSLAGPDGLFVFGKKAIFKLINNRGEQNHFVTSTCRSKELARLLIA
jgi:hypothetical protein